MHIPFRQANRNALHLSNKILNAAFTEYIEISISINSLFAEPLSILISISRIVFSKLFGSLTVALLRCLSFCYLLS